MYTVYGIPNCNSVKKVVDWLTSQEIPFVFHNYKKEGITAAKLKNWCKQQSWELLLNKKGTTWRGLDTIDQNSISNEKAAIGFMVAHTSSIKRPIIEKNEMLIAVGFDAIAYEKLFAL